MKFLIKGLRKVSWILSANIYSALSKFLVLVLIANFTSVIEVGIYSLGLALTAPITLLFNMKMKSVLITDNNPDLPKYISLRKIGNILAFVLLVTISITFYREFMTSLILIGIIKILDLNSDFYQSLPHKFKRFKEPSLLMISKYSLTTIVFGIVISISENLNLALLIYILFQLIHLLIEKKLFNEFTGRIDKFEVGFKSLIGIMVPLGITQMLYTLGASLPKYQLEHYVDIEQLGIFSAIMYIVTIANLFMTSIFQTILPYAKELYEKSIKTFNIYINFIIPIIMLSFTILIAFFVHFFGETLIGIFYGELYSAYAYLLYVLIFAIYFNMLGWLFDSALLIAKKVKLQPYIVILNAILILLIGNALISNWSIVGATITTVLFNFLNFSFKLIYYNFNQRIQHYD